tara:strand:+ start:95 stop:622 length:528 start_codon:yes stop_codon:yes gene_type:complete
MSTLKVNQLQDTSGNVLPFGVTMQDTWVVTSNANVNGAADITSNWAKQSANSESQTGNIGTGMSESSGVFTFPSTGIYFIQSILTVKGNGGRTYMGWRHAVSVNGGSNYENVATSYGSGYMNTAYINVYLSHLLDVTSTSNVKIKFSHNFSDTGYIIGDSRDKHTGVTFTRLGDT